MVPERPPLEIASEVNKANAERRAFVPTFAMRINRARVHFHHGIADCQSQTQTQATELPRDRRFRLLEGVESPRRTLRLHPGPAVVHLGDHPLLIRPTTNSHAAAGRGELDRVLQKTFQASTAQRNNCRVSIRTLPPSQTTFRRQAFSLTNISQRLQLSSIISTHRPTPLLTK